MKEKETKKQSFLSKQFPTLSKWNIKEWIWNLFSIPNIVMIALELWIVKLYIIYINTMSLIHKLVVPSFNFEYEKYSLHESFMSDYSYLFTDVWKTASLFIIITFLITQYINYKQWKLTMLHFIIMLIVVIMLAWGLFTLWNPTSPISILWEAFWYDFSCHMQ